MTLAEFLNTNSAQTLMTAEQFAEWAESETVNPADFVTERFNWTLLSARIGFDEVVRLRNLLAAAIQSADPSSALYAQLTLIEDMLGGEGINLAADQTREILDRLTPSVFDAETSAALKDLGRPSNRRAAGVDAFTADDVDAARQELAQWRDLEALQTRIDEGYHRARVAADNGENWPAIVAAFEGASG